MTCLVDVSVRRGTAPSTPGLVKDVLTECTCWTEYAFVSYISRVYLSDIILSFVSFSYISRVYLSDIILSFVSFSYISRVYLSDIILSFVSFSYISRVYLSDIIR